MSSLDPSLSDLFNTSSQPDLSIFFLTDRPQPDEVDSQLCISGCSQFQTFLTHLLQSSTTSRADSFPSSSFSSSFSSPAIFKNIAALFPVISAHDDLSFLDLTKSTLMVRSSVFLSSSFEATLRTDSPVLPVRRLEVRFLAPIRSLQQQTLRDGSQALVIHSSDFAKDISFIAKVAFLLLQCDTRYDLDEIQRLFISFTDPWFFLPQIGGLSSASQDLLRQHLGGSILPVNRDRELLAHVGLRFSRPQSETNRETSKSPSDVYGEATAQELPVRADITHDISSDKVIRNRLLQSALEAIAVDGSTDILIVYILVFHRYIISDSFAEAVALFFQVALQASVRAGRSDPKVSALDDLQSDLKPILRLTSEFIKSKVDAQTWSIDNIDELLDQPYKPSNKVIFEAFLLSASLSEPLSRLIDPPTDGTESRGTKGRKGSGKEGKRLKHSKVH